MPARRTVPAAILLLALGGLTAPHAGAAPRPVPKVCKLVPDAAGDVYVLRSAPTQTVADDALDIVSADVATNASTISVVIRVKRYALPPSTSPTGSTYEMQFDVSGSSDRFYMNASQSPGVGATYDAGYRTALPAVTTIANSLGTPTGTFDTAKNEIRIWAPLSMFSSRVAFKKGTKVAGIEVFTGRGGRGRGVFSDEATASKAYTHQAPTCVSIGK